MQIESLAKKLADVPVLIPALGDARVMDRFRLLRCGHRFEEGYSSGDRSPDSGGSLG